MIDKEGLEKLNRQQKKIKAELWDLIDVIIVGYNDRENVKDSLAALIRNYNQILNKYKDALDAT